MNYHVLLASCDWPDNGRHYEAVFDEEDQSPVSSGGASLGEDERFVAFTICREGDTAPNVQNEPGHFGTWSHDPSRRSRLENEGAEYVFGIPGEGTRDVNEALDVSEPIEFVPVRHEQAGAFMADAYGRLTVKAGVCLATGIADATLDHAPMVARTAQIGRSDMHKQPRARSLWKPPEPPGDARTTSSSNAVRRCPRGSRGRSPYAAHRRATDKPRLRVVPP